MRRHSGSRTPSSSSGTHWREASVPLWPTGDASRWLLRRAAYHDGTDFLALGIVQPVAGRESALAAAVEAEGV